MNEISLFTQINYVRPSSGSEQTLSRVSHFLYLGGTRATVFNDNEVQLEKGKLAWYVVALKVSAFIGLLPITLTFLVINSALRSKHKFTVIKPSEPKIDTNPEVASQPRKPSLKPVETPVETHEQPEPENLAESQPEVQPKPPLIIEEPEPKAKTEPNPPVVIEEPKPKAKTEPNPPIVIKEPEKRVDVKPTPSVIKRKKREKTPLEKFRQELRLIKIPDTKDLKQIASELFKMVPPDLTLDQLVNEVFACSSFDIIPLLDTILDAHPAYKLSPIDQIRRAIVEDVQNKTYQMTKLTLQDMLGDKEKLKVCHDFAYHVKHPYIYPVSQTPVATQAYTINFLWVNLNPQNRVQNQAQNIFKDGLDFAENAECLKDPKALRQMEANGSLEKQIKDSFTYQISKWADAEPKAQINLWYDSALVTEQAKKNTLEMMKAISDSRGVDLKLRDIRALPNIQGEIAHSLHPGTNVYYRVDLLKMLIADYMMSSPNEQAKYCVVSDVDIEPMSSEQMFDQRTIDYLATHGYVFNRTGPGDFENSFFIFNKENPELQKKHKKMIVQLGNRITCLRIQGPIPSGKHPCGQFAFQQYYDFKRAMQEDDDRDNPRKNVRCPKTQFMFGGYFGTSDFRAENFRFIGKSNVPYTMNGRNTKGGEEQIEALKDWEAVPL